MKKIFWITILLSFMVALHSIKIIVLPATNAWVNNLVALLAMGSVSIWLLVSCKHNIGQFVGLAIISCVGGGLVGLMLSPHIASLLKLSTF